MKQPNQVCAFLLAREKTAGKINSQITTTNKTLLNKKNALNRAFFSFKNLILEFECSF